MIKETITAGQKLRTTSSGKGRSLLALAAFILQVSLLLVPTLNGNCGVVSYDTGETVQLSARAPSISDENMGDVHATGSKDVYASESATLRTGDVRDEANETSSLLSPYRNAKPPREHLLRAILEMTGFTGAAAAYYWTNQDEFSNAFEYDIDSGNFRSRFITWEAYHLDDDNWDVNLEHVPAGAGLYLLARSNDLDILKSFLLTVGASSVWEYFVEVREVISINDSVMTPLGGLAIGEVMYQMGEFFQHSCDSTSNRILGYLFGGPTAFHRWLDGTQPNPPENVDRFGFNTDVWHRFRLSTGYGHSERDEETRDEAMIGLDLQLVTADKYGRQGEESTLYKNGFFNELAFEAALDGGNVADLDFLAKTALFGHYQQKIQKGESSEDLEGHSLFFGLSSAFEYLTHEFPGIPSDDKFAVCDTLGPMAILDYYHAGIHVRAMADIYPNFSMVMPYSREEYKENYDVKGTKRIFRFFDYYYALGLTTGTSLEVTYKDWELNTQAQYRLFDSIEGLERFPETIHDDINLRDQRLWFHAGIGYELLENTKVRFSTEKLFRWSEIKDFESDEDETRFLFELTYDM